MKNKTIKSISCLLSIVLLCFVFPLNVPAEAYEDPSYINNFSLSDYSLEDLMTMNSHDFYILLANFERVYDPFDTYNNNPLITSKYIKKGEVVEPYWTSGNTDLSSTGSHELITARACGILLDQKGFWGGNHDASILISLTISLASILPDRDPVENRGDITFVGHFFDPDTGKNFLGSTKYTALTNTDYYYTKAKNEYKSNGGTDNFYKYVGSMLHYIQDASEPHHASNIVVPANNNAHGKFEKFADEHINDYIDSLKSLSTYEYNTALNSSPSTLVIQTAKEAKSRVLDVNDGNNQTYWGNVAYATTRNAVKYSTMILYSLSIDAGISLIK